MKHLFYFFKRLHCFYGKTLYLNLFGMVIVSFLQGMEIFLLIPMISVSGVIDMNMRTIPGWPSFKLLSSFPESTGLPVILGIFLMLVIFQSFLQRNISRQNAKIHQGFILKLRLEIYRAILESNWQFFIKKRKSDIINSLTTELGRVSGGLATFLRLLTHLIFTVIQIGLALWLSVKLTVFVLICGLGLAFLNRRFVKKAKKLGKLTSELSQNYLSSITDQLNGIKEIKSNTLEESRLTWLTSLTRKMESEQNEYVNLRTNSELSSKIASAALIAFCILLSVKVLHAQPQQLLLIVLIFSRLWPRFAGVQADVEQIASSIPAFRVLESLEKECIDAREVNGSTDSNNNNEPMRIEYGLECRNISFSYTQNESVLALENVTLHIPANCMTAVVGRSGAGKSTLIDILMGLIRPDKGEVLLDGTTLTGDNLLALRRSISYVPQDPFLFNASIRDNLLLIKPNATEEEIWEALKFSASVDFVKRLPEGLDTQIGDRGIRLSGGERQRLVLARAILRKPSVLILDEATSALDTENETRIQEVLDRLKGDMTIIVIAHRLSTIRNAHQVIVLDQGRVIQNGGFNQLAEEKKSMFSSLLGNQLEVSL